nr:hypothetical protein BaRGS_005381 [Batillaria attramentaria]
MLPTCKRADDRAMLLPCFSRDPVDTGAKVKTCVVNSNSELYTITDDSLPSHMRSLIPSHEQHVHDLLTLERTRRRLRYLIVTLSGLLALTVLVAVVLVFSLKIKSPGRGEDRSELFLWYFL